MDLITGSISAKNDKDPGLQSIEGKQDSRIYSSPSFDVMPLAIMVRSGGYGRGDTGSLHRT